MDEFTARLGQKLQEMLDNGVTRIIVSKPAPGQQSWRRLELERRNLSGGCSWQLAKYSATQVFHENLADEAAAARAAELAAGGFLQVNGFGETAEYTLLLSRKGQMTLRKSPRAPKQAATAQKGGRNAGNAAKTPAAASCLPLPPSPAAPAHPAVAAQKAIPDAPAHDRQKHYLLPEGTVVPPLVDMGIFTPDGRVVKARYDKFRQINRFIELIDDALKEAPPKQLNIIDFGCGRSYLTFLIYYYLHEVRGIRLQMIGLDLKAEVIANCEAAARRYGYDGLHFQLGDIHGYEAPFAVDMVVSLHACDTATDHALYNAVRWGARMIFSVPCCQHELNGQMHPQTLALLGRYGLVQERFAALATDAIRARLLEYCGYKTQLLEFVDFAHTPKNLLIRARRRPALSGMPDGLPDAARLSRAQQQALDEVRALQQEFCLQPTLCTLLGV